MGVSCDAHVTQFVTIDAVHLSLISPLKGCCRAVCYFVRAAGCIPRLYQHHFVENVALYICVTVTVIRLSRS